MHKVDEVIERLRAKHEKRAMDESAGRKERSRCSHYVQALDELRNALNGEKNG